MRRAKMNKITKKKSIQNVRLCRYKYMSNIAMSFFFFFLEGLLRVL